MLSDTHPDAERVQIELLRKAGAAERLGMSLALTATVVNRSRQTIASLNPGLDPQQLNIKCVELYYGKELAGRLRKYLTTEHSDVAI
jgi:PP-loop superfamily ATP-utilizing enzyme